MCLQTITERIENPTLDERTGWKVLKRIEDILYPPLFMVVDNPMPNGYWQRADRGFVNGDTEEQDYLAGFHVMKTREGARAFMNCEFGNGIYHSGRIGIYKVKIRGIRTIGKQAGHDCYVADEMFIPVNAKKER